MDISAMDPQNVQELFDTDVVGPDGEQIGSVEQIFADDVTGTPTFITVRNADRECCIPVSGADLGENAITIPFSKDVVDAAPTAPDTEELSLEQETSLYRYYGIRPPRRSTVGRSDSEQAASESPVTPSHAQAEEPGELDHEPTEPAAPVRDSAESDSADSDSTGPDSTGADPIELDPTVPDATDLDSAGSEVTEPAGPADLELPEQTEAEPWDANEFRSIADVEESQDPAAPEPTADDVAAEEAAVLGDDASALDDEPSEVGEADPPVEGRLPAEVAGTAAVAGVAGLEGSAISEDASPDEAFADQGSPEELEDPLAAPILEAEDVAQIDAEEDSEVSAEQLAGGLPAGATLRKYVITEMVTVQVPVRREVVCYQDADGVLHELETVAPPASATSAESSTDPANWWSGNDPASTDEPAGTDAGDPEDGNAAADRHQS